MGFKKGPGWEERDDKERNRERHDMAFKLAKTMQKNQRKELEKRGLSPEEIKGRLESVGHLADYLAKTKPKELDDLVAKQKEALGQGAKKSKKSLGNVGRRTANEIRNIGSKFKGYLDGKRDLRNREKEKNDTKNDRLNPSRKEGTPRSESLAKRESPAGREGKERQNRSDSQPPISVKDLFKGVRQLQKEKAATPRESIRSKEQAHKRDVEKASHQPKPSERNEGERRPSRFGEIQSKQEFDKARENYPDLESKKSFEKQLDESEQYFEDKLEGKETSKPALVGKIEARERRRIYEAVHEGPPAVKIESIQDVDKLLDEDSEKRKHHNFREQYRRSKVYFEVTDDWSKMEKDLAREHDISESTIGNYRRKIEPHLISNLRKSEETRIIDEWVETSPVEDIPREVLHHRIERMNLMINPQIHNIDYESVNRHFNQEIEKIGVKNVTNSIRDVIRDVPDSNSKVMVLNLQQSELNSMQLKDLEKVVRSNSRAISESLSTKIEKYEDVRVGIVQDKLYVWIPTQNKDCMIDAWQKQYFHFQSSELSKLVNETGTQLNLGNTQYEKLKNFNELIQQMNPDTHLDIKIQESVNHQNPRISGEVLRFQRDLLGVSAKDFDGRVTKVAGKNGVGGIENPHFLHGLELEKERARLLSIIKSDGWVSHDGKVGYVEQNLKRFDIVEQNLQVWGNFELGRYYNSKTGTYETKLPSPFWDALTFWGFSPGDKPIHNEGLPLNIDKLSYESMSIYLGELIPEDGGFGKKGKFSWSRTIVLDPGTKGERYGFESLISPDIVDFIKNRGDDGSHPRGEPKKFINVSKLQEITKAQDSMETDRMLAEKLHSIVYSNPSKLIEDEARMAERLGIDVAVNPRKIRYYPGTGRVSVYWECQTSGVKAAEKFAIVCPPNDEKKRNQVKQWILQRNLDSTLKKIEEERIPYKKWWL